jgi:hypothetical protein
MCQTWEVAGFIHPDGATAWLFPGPCQPWHLHSVLSCSAIALSHALRSLNFPLHNPSFSQGPSRKSPWRPLSPCSAWWPPPRTLLRNSGYFSSWGPALSPQLCELPGLPGLWPPAPPQESVPRQSQGEWGTHFCMYFPFLKDSNPLLPTTAHLKTVASYFIPCHNCFSIASNYNTSYFIRTKTRSPF